MIETRQLFIAGQDTPAEGGRTTEDLDPYTGEVFATVAAASPADVTRAVDAAAAAFPAWAAATPTERRAVLLAAADGLQRRADEVVELMAGETGAVAGWAYFNVGLAAGMLREAAALAGGPVGEVLGTDTPGAVSMAIRQPAGVVAAFAPWNAPVILGTRAIATPLAVGNTVVVKASEDAPVACALLIAEVLAEAGLPDGVLNVVTNDRADAAAIAATLIADPRVRRVNFTGSTAVGRRIGVLAAEHLKPALLELGGKNALIVRADADLAYAAQAVAFGAYLNAGQICMSTDRVLVHHSIVEEFTARLVERVQGLGYGDPRDPGTVVGPLINAAAANRVADLVEAATGDGAKVLVGGGRPTGAVYRPTVVSNVDADMPIFTEESFGPVCAVLAVRDDEQAVAIANDTPYGLTAGVLTEDLARGWDIARRLETGIVHVNDQSVDDEPQAPFGGVKGSGYGRFGGRAGVDAFTDLRWITIQQGHRPFPF
jgi:acyl-CoA reductase-like NAD-dependent aldehyde dehydrogenase